MVLEIKDRKKGVSLLESMRLEVKGQSTDDLYESLEKKETSRTYENNVRADCRINTWAKHFCAIPTLLIHAAIFKVRKPGKSREVYSNDVFLGWSEKYKTTFSGEELQQTDLRVLAAVLDACNNNIMMAESVEIQGSNLLKKSLKRKNKDSIGSKDYKELDILLNRLESVKLTVFEKNKNKYWIDGNILSWNKSKGNYSIIISNDIYKLICTKNLTKVPMEYRDSCVDEFEQFLLYLVTSHGGRGTPIYTTLDKLLVLSALKSIRLTEMSKRVDNTLNKFIKLKLVEKFQIEKKGKVTIFRKKIVKAGKTNVKGYGYTVKGG